MRDVLKTLGLMRYAFYERRRIGFDAWRKLPACRYGEQMSTTAQDLPAYIYYYTKTHEPRYLRKTSPRRTFSELFAGGCTFCFRFRICGHMVGLLLNNGVSKP
jgi:hypothetical protein